MIWNLELGGVALGMMLVAEFTLVLCLWSVSTSEYLAGRDPVSGMVYYVMPGVFAVMPVFAG